MFRAVCEPRYSDAYLIYDRTGEVVHEVQKFFNDVRVLSATPNQTAMQSDQGALALELGQCRLTSDKPDSNLETFARHCKQYFDIVSDCFDIKVFTRIGLRLLFRKTTTSLDESKAALNSLNLLNRKPVRRFGAAEHPEEFIFRWEGSQIGAMLRVKAETSKIDIILPPELAETGSDIHKSINGLVLDVDYYTVAPVERAQWDATAWVPQSMRTIKREIDSILEG